MDNKKNTFIQYLEEVIDGNSPNILGTRAILGNGPAKQLSVIAGILKLPQDEEIVIFFDDTLMGSGKGGLVLTSWGIHYKDASMLTKWDLSWAELSEKYTFYSEGIFNKKLKLRNGKGNIFTIEKEITLTMASFDIQWLERILNAGCRIFTGKEIGSSQGTTENQLVTEKTKTEIKTVSPVSCEHETNKKTQPDERERAEIEISREKEHREDDKDRTEAEAIMNGEAISFFTKNKGGIILAVALVFLVDISICTGDAGASISIGQKILFCLLNIISFPLSFLGCLLGNQIRLAIHPDFIIASGFMGLLKERIFWRFGPQLIGALIGSLITAAIILKILGFEAL
jgi:hypothetical protein